MNLSNPLNTKKLSAMLVVVSSASHGLRHSGLQSNVRGYCVYADYVDLCVGCGMLGELYGFVWVVNEGA